MLALTALTCASVCSAPAANTGWVRTSGRRFELNGRPCFFAGANFWQGVTMGIDGEAGDRSRLERELDRLAAAGIRNLRVMAAAEGPDGEPYRIVPSLQPSPGVYNPDVFAALDYLLDRMNARNLRAVMVLNNFWHWSGGMAQYVSWAHGGESIPYPNDTGDWEAFQQYAAVFYTNTQCQTWFRSFIDTILCRTNTENGVVYRDDPTIFAWELGNEPRRYPQAWIDDTAVYIKSLDTNHMVTTGTEGEGPWLGEDFIQTHNGAAVDYTTCHIWPQNWDWYDPADPASYASAEAQALDFLGNHLAMAASLDKPLVLEEFGLARDRGPPLHDEYDPAATTTNRDAFYRTMFDAIFDSAASGGPAAGDNFWVWAGEARPTGPATNWMGDPPHEKAGWYSVYDADTSTIQTVSAHAADLAALSFDTDWDGLPDDWENLWFGGLTNTTGAAGEDWDKDDFIDRHEYVADTDPTDPSSWFWIWPSAGTNAGDVVISWHSASGRLYTVRTASEPAAGWTNTSGFAGVAGVQGGMSYTNPAAAESKRFYRVNVDLAPP